MRLHITLRPDHKVYTRSPPTQLQQLLLWVSQNSSSLDTSWQCITGLITVFEQYGNRIMHLTLPMAHALSYP